MSQDVGYYLPAGLIMPSCPRAESEVLPWVKQFHNAIQDAYMQIADRVENMVMVAEAYSELPTLPQTPAVDYNKGQRQLFYCLATNELLLDLIDIGAAPNVTQWRAVDTDRGRKITGAVTGQATITFARPHDGSTNVPPVVHLTVEEPAGMVGTFAVAWIVSWTRVGGAGTDYTGCVVEARDSAGNALATYVHWRVVEQPK